MKHVQHAKQILAQIRLVGFVVPLDRHGLRLELGERVLKLDEHRVELALTLEAPAQNEAKQRIEQGPESAFQPGERRSRCFDAKRVSHVTRIDLLPKQTQLLEEPAFLLNLGAE